MRATSQVRKGVIELGTIPLAIIEKLTDDVTLPSLSLQPDRKQPRELLQIIVEAEAYEEIEAEALKDESEIK